MAKAISFPLLGKSIVLFSFFSVLSFAIPLKNIYSQSDEDPQKCSRSLRKLLHPINPAEVRLRADEVGLGLLRAHYQFQVSFEPNKALDRSAQWIQAERLRDELLAQRPDLAVDYFQLRIQDLTRNLPDISLSQKEALALELKTISEFISEPERPTKVRNEIQKLLASERLRLADLLSSWMEGRINQVEKRLHQLVAIDVMEVGQYTALGQGPSIAELVQAVPDSVRPASPFVKYLKEQNGIEGSLLTRMSMIDSLSENLKYWSENILSKTDAQRAEEFNAEFEDYYREARQLSSLFQSWYVDILWKDPHRVEDFSFDALIDQSLQPRQSKLIEIKAVVENAVKHSSVELEKVIRNIQENSALEDPRELGDRADAFLKGMASSISELRSSLETLQSYLGDEGNSISNEIFVERVSAFKTNLEAIRQKLIARSGFFENMDRSNELDLIVSRIDDLLRWPLFTHLDFLAVDSVASERARFLVQENLGDLLAAEGKEVLQSIPSEQFDTILFGGFSPNVLTISRSRLAELRADIAAFKEQEFYLDSAKDDSEAIGQKVDAFFQLYDSAQRVLKDANQPTVKRFAAQAIIRRIHDQAKAIRSSLQQVDSQAAEFHKEITDSLQKLSQIQQNGEVAFLFARVSSYEQFTQLMKWVEAQKLDWSRIPNEQLERLSHFANDLAQLENQLRQIADYPRQD